MSNYHPIYTWKLVNGPNHNPELLSNIHGDTLDEVSRQLPSGCYTTILAYPFHRVLFFSRHIERLNESSWIAGFPQLLDEQILRSTIRRILPSTDESRRIRITLDLTLNPGDLYISTESLKPIGESVYKEGVKVITHEYMRVQPRAKLTAFIINSQEMRSELTNGVNEVLMVDDAGNITEGLTSNFFAFIDNTLRTAQENILEGITRSLVLEVANRNGIMVLLRPVQYNQIHCLQEAFITSSSRNILPVKSIDDVQIINGTVGPKTQQLMNEYNLTLKSLLEDI